MLMLLELFLSGPSLPLSPCLLRFSLYRLPALAFPTPNPIPLIQPHSISSCVPNLDPCSCSAWNLPLPPTSRRCLVDAVTTPGSDVLSKELVLFRIIYIYFPFFSYPGSCHAFWLFLILPLYLFFHQTRTTQKQVQVNSIGPFELVLGILGVVETSIVLGKGLVTRTPFP
jgi:hypothetical protein